MNREQFQPANKINYFILYKSQHLGRMRFWLIYFCIWEITSWCFRTSLSENSAINQVDWAPDNSIFVSASNGDKVVKIYNASTFELISVYNNSGNTPTTVKISKDNKWIGIGYSNNDLHILNAVSPFSQYWTTAGSYKVIEVDFSYDNKTILTCGSNDKKYDIYNISSKSNLVTNSNIPGASGSDSSIACKYGPLGHAGFSDVNQDVRVMDSSRSNVYNVKFSGNILGIDFKPASGDFGTVSADNKLRIPNSTALFTDTGSLRTISIGRKGNYFAFGGNSKTLFIYNQATDTATNIFSNFNDTINSVKISPDQNFIITGDNSGEIRIFSLQCNLTCKSGEYNDSGVCKKCSDAIDQCLNCKSNSYCDQCSPGFYPSGGSCIVCYANLNYCLECGSSSQCFKCLNGFYLSGGKCVKCPMVGCLECNDSVTCTKCFKNDFYLNTSTNACLQCSDALQNCIRCADSVTCVDCHLGFFVNPTTNKCDQCPGNCLICQSNSNCTACKTGYWPSGGSCIRCTDSNCISCNQTGVCYVCGEGMLLNAANSCINCTKPCSTCSVTGTNCTSCIVGYYFDSVNFQCQNCISNCQVCNESGKCLSCFLGFTLDSTSLTCQPCSVSYGDCSECSSTQCFKCRSGFYLDISAGNTCKRCIEVIPNCISCGDSSVCLECLTNYFVTGLTGTSSCGACPAGCSKCVSGNNCTECFSTYFLDVSLLCLPCQSNCFQCTSANSCNSCVVGYYLDSTTCKPCQSILSYCTSCIDANTCNSCTIGAYLDSVSKKCSLCVSNCLTCNETDCYSCEMGFYVDVTVSPLSCKECSDSCQQCTSIDVCTSCVDGFYLDSTDNKCKSCSPYFPHCTLCNKTNCFECSKGTVLNISTLSTCTPCTDFISSCKTCYWDNSLTTPAVKCQLCNYGFGLVSTNLSCFECSSIEGCIACSSSSKCTNCKLGFYLKSDNTCGICSQKCFTCDNSLTCLSCKEGFVNDTTDCVLCETKIDGCSKCVYDTGLNYNCTFCQVGYFLEPTDNKCYICHEKITGCYTCNDSLTCTGCLDRYYLDIASGSCKKCIESMAGCQLCNSSSICISCKDSYYLDVSTSKCLFCSNNIPGCFICQSNTQCSQCEAGFYLHVDKTCSSCEAALQGCVYCTSDTYCIQCRAGFYLNTTDNKCHQCTQPGCNICDQLNPSNCLSCNNMFFLSGNVCSDCINLVPHCYECNNTECLSCEVGFYLASPLMCSQCSSAMEGCSRCHDGTTCLECMSSYFVNGSNLCQQCNKVLVGCQNCQNGSVCISCVTNFFLNSTNNECQSCTDLSGCMLCKNESTCLLCQEKYYLDGSGCKLCSNDMKGCFSCSSSSVCVQCQSGYVLDSVSYECKVNIVEAKQKVEGLKLVSYYVNPDMLKHVLLAKGISFKPNEKLNLTASGMTQLVLQDYSGKETKLKILSYQFEKNGYSIVFHTDNPLGNQVNLSNSKMTFRRLLNEGRLLTDQEINLKVLLKMEQNVYQQILPDLDYSGSMTVGYSLNDPEFTRSYFQVEAEKDFFAYNIIGIVFIVLFLINYFVKFLCTLPHSRNRNTLLPHIIALKACCLIVYPNHFEYLSFCKGFMAVDFYWLNDGIAAEVTNLSDKVAVPFGLFFQNMSIGGTFLLGLGVYIFLVCCVQCWFYLVNDQKGKSEEQIEPSQLSEEEERRREKEFRIQNVETMIGVNYDNDESEGNKYVLIRRNLLELLWNIFTFSVVYYSCLSVQGAFYNYQQIITVGGVFYILGMLLFIFVTIETFYSFIRNMKRINKVRVFLKGCLLSLSYLNPIYVTSVCVAVDIVLIVISFNVINNKNQLSRYLTVSHILCTICIILMIFISQSLLSLLLTGISLLTCLGLEIYIHIKEYLIANQTLDSNQLSPDCNQQVAQNNPSQFNLISDVRETPFETDKKKSNFNNFNETMGIFKQTINQPDNLLKKEDDYLDQHFHLQNPKYFSTHNTPKQGSRHHRIRSGQQVSKPSLISVITNRNEHKSRNIFDIYETEQASQE